MPIASLAAFGPAKCGACNGNCCCCDATKMIATMMMQVAQLFHYCFANSEPTAAAAADAALAKEAKIKLLAIPYPSFKFLRRRCFIYSSLFCFVVCLPLNWLKFALADMIDRRRRRLLQAKRCSGPTHDTRFGAQFQMLLAAETAACGSIAVPKHEQTCCCSRWLLLRASGWIKAMFRCVTTARVIYTNSNFV